MNRDEILEKSRKENAVQDERELQIYYRAGSIAKAIGCILCTLISAFVTIMSDHLGIVSTACWTIYVGMASVECWFFAARLKEQKSYWAWAAIFSVFFVLFGAFFARELLTWTTN